jgi:hypothetical protein
LAAADEWLLLACHELTRKLVHEIERCCVLDFMVAARADVPGRARSTGISDDQECASLDAALRTSLGMTTESFRAECSESRNLHPDRDEALDR